MGVLTNFKKIRPLRILSCLLIIIGSFFVWGFVIEPSFLIQKDLKVDQWPGPPLKIVFFSDLHAGAPHIDQKYIQDLISRINDLSPDLILIGGDLVINNVVGGTHMPIESVAVLLKNLRAPLGVFAVLGNHDWWNKGEHIRLVLENNHIRVLENESQKIDLSPQFHFWLVGIGDDFTEHADIDLAMKKIDSNAPRVLFMHDPGALLDIKTSFQFALAGHLHGGQVYVPGIGALVTPGRAPKEWASGTVDFKYGKIFVSKGVGTSIIPVRFNALPEFVMLSVH